MLPNGHYGAREGMLQGPCKLRVGEVTGLFLLSFPRLELPAPCFPYDFLAIACASWPPFDSLEQHVDGSSKTLDIFVEPPTLSLLNVTLLKVFQLVLLVLWCGVDRELGNVTFRGNHLPFYKPQQQNPKCRRKSGSKSGNDVGDVKWRCNFHSRLLVIYRSASHASIKGRRRLRGGHSLRGRSFKVRGDNQR